MILLRGGIPAARSTRIRTGRLSRRAAFRRYRTPLLVGAAAIAVVSGGCQLQAALRTSAQASLQASARRALASVFVVSPDGNDSSPGTAAKPFLTLQRAADAVNPGDTVIVEDGVYTRPVNGTRCDNPHSQPVVCLGRGGNNKGWVTFKARHRWGAKIDGAGNAATAGFRFTADANYIHISGFDVFGVGSRESSAAGFELYEGGHDVVISQNRIHDVGRLCTDTTNGQTAIFVQQPNVTITQNAIYDIGRFAPGEQGCVVRTSYYQNHDHGIYLDGQTPPGASGATISNNVFYAHQHGWAIQLYPGELNGVTIFNNTFASPNPYNVGHIIVAASTEYLQILNNLFIDPQRAAINFYSGSHGDLIIANNMTNRALATSVPEGALFRNNVETTDPEVADTDFRLQPTSPAVARGTVVTRMTVDIDGVPRPSDAPPDIGAHQLPPSADTAGIPR